MMDTSNKVLFKTLGSATNHQIGVATLNAEKSLNALSLEMVQALILQLTRWQQDDNISIVIIDGAGDKAFCAGGDVRAIYHASYQCQGEIAPLAVDFFSQEYRLDYLLHTFGKPVLVWGDGIVMGGGIGILVGASHRVVTENSRLAMPEITIGLYPDVGGSYFLNRLPGHIGRFLGMTGYNMTPADACFVGIGNYHVARDDKSRLFNSLSKVNWTIDNNDNHRQLDVILNQLSKPLLPSQLALRQPQIDRLMSDNPKDIVDKVAAAKGSDSWLEKPLKTLLAGSPLSLHLIYQQSCLGKKLTLKQAFQFELDLSCHCCARGDFVEGVRALLVDKDRRPQWQYSDVADVPSSLVANFLTSPWKDNEHPLASL